MIIDIIDNFRYFGKNFIKIEKKTIKIVILKPETAIKWVSPELLKFFFSSGGNSSLAQSSIHHKKIASFFGKFSFIIDNNFSLNKIIFSSSIKIFFFSRSWYLFAYCLK